MNDLERSINEIALNAGKSRLSEQTGFVHHHYHILDESPQSIPFLENAIFAYALLKNKSFESIQEAKDLLTRLLHFQCLDKERSYGNFPIYIHDYPMCNDRLLGIKLLPVFYWILHQFGSVLGSELNEKLVISSRLIISFSLVSAKERQLPYSYQLKLGCALKAYGELFKDKEYLKHGEELLSDLGVDQLIIEWFSPQILGDMLISLQMLYSSIKDSPWSKFWEHLSSTFDTNASTYTGPCYQQYYLKTKAQQSIYDAFMVTFTGKEFSCLKNDEILALHSALIQPHSDQFPNLSFPVHLLGEIDGRKWQIWREEFYSVSTIDHIGDKLDSLWKGVIPVQLCWMQDDRVLTLVAQGGNYQQVHAETAENSISIDYLLPKDVDVDHKEEKREVILSLTKDEHLALFVNGEKSNTFRLEDNVEVRSKTLTLSLQFKLVEGEGRFVGHIMPGNRASQLALKNSNRFNAYDWQLFLRTLDRSELCRVHVTINPQRTL